MKRIVLAMLFLGAAAVSAAKDTGSIFQHSLLTARDALAEGRLNDAATLIQRALERDPKSPRAWELRAQWAAAYGDRDEQVFALHKQFNLLMAQKAKKPVLKELRARIEALDPVAKELFQLREGFIDRLQPIADLYTKEGRPHSAIRVLQEILALDPESEATQAEIERISASPDPSLASTAKPKDLMADVSVEWVREHDAKHLDWKQAATTTREHYVTKTDAGYEVLVRAAEAMEQMNAFYRRFFQYGGGDDNRSVPRITLHIFKNRDEYLTLGIGPPVEWSGGHFTGSHVETYIGQGGFEECVGTLFHEAAHQFVGLATTASGWLNEGLASFFEGCRILSNGTVIMNMPANHRLFPLVERLKKGWMRDSADGLSGDDPNATPETAPTLQIIIENKYSWGPPWYAPTWGFVFFLYNYQDPADGRFIYRTAFNEFINASGGRVGEGAVENFEKVVLANPQRPTKGLPRTEALRTVKTVEELNEVWKDWLIDLADEQSGKAEAEKPYLEWALYAIERREYDIATEHFEKGLVRTPEDVDLLAQFADHLALREKNTDRATKLILTALQIVEAQEEADPKLLRDLEARLSKWDPKRDSLAKIHEQMWTRAEAIVKGYLDNGLPMMAMEVSWRLGTQLRVSSLFSLFEQAARSSGKSIALWQLAYNEEDLSGWTTGGDIWKPYGGELWSSFGPYREDSFDYNFLTYDTITSGDFSMEVEVLAEREKNSFCGLVFGRKSAQTFHAVILHPGRNADREADRIERQGSLDLTTFFGSDSSKVWRNNKVDTRGRGWHKIRLDVIGSEVDVWFDGEFVVTHDFGDSDVLRGSFGLITGPGSAKYRNVRYLAREARDPGSQIERTIKMEALEKAAGGGSLGGSWLRKVPAFPKVATWVQGGRTGFAERGPVPTLLVFWSIEQNKILPIDKWLMSVAKEHSDVGLEIISIAHYQDGPELPAFLEKHPFPGSVAVDSKVQSRLDSGETFEMYALKKFGMPRVVLLDIDQKVYWEGDPGIEAGIGWKPGMDTFVDDPLRELVKRRRLKDLRRWSELWKQEGAAALGAGDLEKVLPLLQKAMELPGRQVPMVADAQRWLRALRDGLGNLPRMGEVTAENEASSAMATLAEWCSLMEVELESSAKRTVRMASATPAAKDWATACKTAEKLLAGLKPGKEWTALEAYRQSLASQSGLFQKELGEDLDRAIASRDLPAARDLLAQIKRRPAVWLVFHFAEQ
ncbi:MAG: family 16 glycoside hydrolase [Planctomycetota bacterium]